MQNKQSNLAEMLTKWQTDPLSFFLLCWPDIFTYAKLEEIAEAIVEYKRISVRAGHGVGKTWLLARIAIWFLTCFKPSKVITTAPTWTQVEKVLWAEIASAYKTSRFPLGGDLLQTQWKISEDCYALGLSTKENMENRDFGSTKLQGFHSPNLLVILDEAAGVPKEIWTAATSLITGGNNKIIAIGNPAIPSGPFFDSQKSPIWHKIHISCFDHPNVKEGKIIVPGAVTREWIEERKEEWGEESPLYKAKVIGEFPKEGSDTLISLAWIERAMTRDDIKPEGPVAIGCDVARYGQDETVIGWGAGNYFDLASCMVKQSTTETTGRIAALVSEREAVIAGVDDTGVGGGVTDQLTEQGITVRPINFGAQAVDSKRFANLKAEIFWLLREGLEKDQIRLPNDERLKSQLASIKFGYTSKGQIKIESKDEMKKRGLKSPDRADAIAITYYVTTTQEVPEVMWI